MEKKFAIGDTVKCQKFASLNHDFEGKIQKIYENSAMVEITNYHQEDTIAVGDFHNRAVVSLKKMKKN